MVIVCVRMIDVKILIINSNYNAWRYTLTYGHCRVSRRIKVLKEVLHGSPGMDTAHIIAIWNFCVFVEVYRNSDC